MNAIQVDIEPIEVIKWRDNTLFAVEVDRFRDIKVFRNEHSLRNNATQPETDTQPLRQDSCFDVSRVEIDFYLRQDDNYLAVSGKEMGYLYAALRKIKEYDVRQHTTIVEEHLAVIVHSDRVCVQLVKYHQPKIMFDWEQLDQFAAMLQRVVPGRVYINWFAWPPPQLPS